MTLPVPQQRSARILIVDDSAVMRSLLRTVVSSDSRLEVVGTASDGASALLAVDSIRPDLVLLDVEMPGMDGLSTLKQMRSGRNPIPVIMCSSLTQRGAKVTIEALASGAADYVAKPSGQSSREGAMQSLAENLIPKILALTASATSLKVLNSIPSVVSENYPGAFGAIAPVAYRSGGTAVRVSQSVVTSPESNRASVTGFSSLPSLPNRLATSAQAVPVASSNAVAPTHLRSCGSAPPAVLVIGVSTGGPAALDCLLPSLPADFPLPILIVQHMPELFTSMLAERLNGRCSLRVREASSGEPIRAGTIHIARGGWHMEVAPSPRSLPSASHNSDMPAAIRLTQEAPENHCRPAADVLFRTAVSVFGSRVLGVVLTGMGNDGLIGSRLICERGGTVLAQDQATSAVWGMPGAVAQAGLAHRVLPLNAIAPEILRIAGRSQREAIELRESIVIS